MDIERSSRTHAPRPALTRNPGRFDVVESGVTRAMHHHVRLRDACLAPSSQIAGKIDLLDRHRWSAPAPSSAATVHRPAPISVVAQMADIRREIRDGGSTLPFGRRLLVLLDVLAALPISPGADLTWSRPPVDLVGEAALGLGCSVSDVRRLTRHLTLARQALPPVTIGPSTTRALAESLRAVLDCTPGSAVAQSVLLLSDDVPSGWSPSGCGTVLLDRLAEGPTRFVGSVIARHDLAAFVDDLATLRVAANVHPDVRAHAAALLPELATELRALPCHPAEQQTNNVAAALTDRTRTLIDRGFRRFDRVGRHQRHIVGR